MLCFRCGSYNTDDMQKCTVCSQELVDKAGKNIGPQKRPTTGQQQALIFSPGELIANRYRIVELMGQGGVGAVYRARDTEVDVDVALKGISPNLLQTDEEQKQFSKAIKLARKLQHPNIVRIYDEGQHLQPNRRFFTMKLLEGLTLRKIIRLRHDKGQAFSPEELTPIFHQLGAALDYAHKQTWHGDLKPENVLVLPDLLKITDFNLVKGLPLKPFLGIAKSRSKAFPYIAPELRVEAQGIDTRTDIYSLGVIFAEMLTGIVFEGHFSRAFTAALEQLPTRLDALIRRALAEHPDGRFPKASEMATEVEAALNALGGQPLPAPAATKELPSLSKPPSPAAAALKPAGQPRVEPVHPHPGPPPLETNPSLSIESLSAAEEDLSLVEIGHSQVLLLESAVVDLKRRIGTKPAETDMELAARRLMSISGIQPDDTADDPTLRMDASSQEEIDTSPGGRPIGSPPRNQMRPGLISSGERPPPGGGDLMGGPFPGEPDDQLVPPPLQGDDSDVSDPSDLDSDADDHSRTVENQHVSGEGPRRNQNPPRAPIAASSDNPGPPSAPHPVFRREPAIAMFQPEETEDSLEETSELSLREPPSSAAEMLGLTADDPPYSTAPEPSEATLAIHDALTALKLHPRLDLVEDPALREALTRTAGTLSAQAEEDDLPPALPETHDINDDSLKETMTSGRPVLQLQEHDLSSAHVMQPLVPFVPLRPVVPPRRAKPSSSPVLIAAVVGFMALLVLLAVRELWKRNGAADTEDVAGVTIRPADSGLLADAASARAFDVAEGKAFVDAGSVAVLSERVDDAAILRERIPAVARAEAEIQRRESAAALLSSKVVEPKVVEPKVVEPKVVEPKVVEPKVDLAMASASCPNGTVKIDAGSFTFGSSQSDPMRNFGEGDATTVEVPSFCIEHYEAPNGKNSLPTTGVSWTAAKNACERAGRRLCTEQEWERACKGPSSSRFPYGNTYDADVCNTEDADGKGRPLAAPIDFKKCRSGFKLYMMAGNAEEWVSDSAGGQKIAKGGSADLPDFASRCSARHVLSAKSSSSTMGYRCCATPR